MSFVQNVCPINEHGQLIWKSDDPVHGEFNQLMFNNVTCKACVKQDEIGYDVEIDIPSKSLLIEIVWGTS